MNTAIKANHVNKSFEVGSQNVAILKDVSIEIKATEFVVIFGPSGSGKSTLLHVLLGLEPPDSGTVELLGTDVYNDMNEDERGNFRKTNIGMVYQQPNWVKSLTVVENVALPMLLTGAAKKHAIWQANDIMSKLNMDAWGKYNPSELSSGQQQRVALARALINNPQIIITDEPTGNLDFESGRQMMELLSDLNKKHNKTIVMVTHDLEYISYSHKAIQMRDGKVEDVYGDNDKRLAKILSAQARLTNTSD